MEILPKNLTLLEKTVGYEFRDKSLLSLAMTHSSFSNEARSRNMTIECNERLEFFGDSILSVIVSEYLYLKFSDCPEGELTRMRAEVVCERALAGFANQINLGDYLYLGHGEEKGGGRHRPSILSDAFESLLAAMYIDCGYDRMTVAKFLMPIVSAELDELEKSGSAKDYKTLLQQLVQQGGEVLEYVVVGESGPDHAKTFEVEAKLNSNVIGRGEGGSKRAAEQAAAKVALELFGEK